MRADGTVDQAERDVLAILAVGPCATSGHTEAGRWRFVDVRVCRRLGKAGLVVIDRAGWAMLTDKGREAVGAETEER